MRTERNAYELQMEQEAYLRAVKMADDLNRANGLPIIRYVWQLDGIGRDTQPVGCLQRIEISTKEGGE